MIRALVALPALALATALGAGCSSERGERAAPPTGQVVFLRHCASCHGSAGKGDGPVATSLARPPSDLTTIARRNGGRFDESAVMAFIDGERYVAEHGTREMPVWGAVFQREHSAREEPWPAYIALLEVRSLVDYLRSIQEP
jgi:mono/diheme cytochrome c family protein